MFEGTGLAELTVFEVSWVGVQRPRNNGKLDLLKLLALDASPLRQALFRFLENLTL
jgi:hypothetical protein